MLLHDVCHNHAFVKKKIGEIVVTLVGFVFFSRRAGLSSLYLVGFDKADDVADIQ